MMKTPLPDESLRLFKRFVVEVSRATTIRDLMQCARKVYTKLLPESCFCLWLLDKEKNRFCRWVYEPQADCLEKLPLVVVSAEEPLYSWFQEKHSRTITPPTNIQHSPVLHQNAPCIKHLIPLGSPAGVKLLLIICSSHPFPQAEWFQDFLDGMTHTALQALERIRMTNEAQLLSCLTKLANQSKSREAFLDSAVHRLREAFSAEGCSIFLYEGLKQKLVVGATTGLVTPKGSPLERVEYKLGEGLTGWIGQHRKVARIFNTHDEFELRELDPTGQLRVSTKSLEGPLEIGSQEPRQFLGLPILLGGRNSSEAKLVGVLRLHKKQFGVAFFPQDERLARVVCNTLASAIERWSLTEHESRLTASLFAVLEAIHAEDKVERILDIIVEKAKTIFDGCAATLMLKQPDNDKFKLHVVADIGYGSHSAHRELEITIGEGAIGEVVQLKCTVAVPQLSPRGLGVPYSPMAQSAIYTPILFGGVVRGVLGVESEHGGYFNPDDHRTIRIIEAFATQAAVAIHRAEVADERLALQQNLVRVTGLITASTVASGLSHELKNGLTVISTLAESIERDPSIKAKKANLEKLELLQQHSLNLFRLAQRLMDLTRIGEPLKQPEYLNEIVQDTASLLQPLVNRHGLELELELDSSLARPSGHGVGIQVEVDRTQIAQVLTNLVLNAIHASSKRQRIILRTRNLTDQRVEFSVRDFGAGISAEDKRQLFDLFFTTRLNGFGVGLHVAQVLVEQHNGVISFDTKQGAGTTFIVKLPKKKKTKGDFYG